MKIACALCGADTPFDDETLLEKRESTYVEGTGQLCTECYKRISDNSEMIERALGAVEAEKYNLLPLDPCKPIERAGCPICFQLVPAIGILLDYVVFKCRPCGKLFRKDDTA